MSSRLIGWLMVAIVAFTLANLVAYRFSDDGPAAPRSDSGSCESVWQTHLANARYYGFSAGPHDAFVKQCEDGHAALN